MSANKSKEIYWILSMGNLPKSKLLHFRVRIIDCPYEALHDPV